MLASSAKKYLTLEPSMRWRLEMNAARLKRQRELEAIEHHQLWVKSWQVWEFSVAKIIRMAMIRKWTVKRVLLVLKKRWVIRKLRR